MSLLAITTKYSPLRNPVLVNRPCRCKRNQAFLTAAALFGMQQERVIIGYQRWCGRCMGRTTPYAFNLETPESGRRVTFSWRQTLSADEIEQIREAVTKAYKNPATYGRWNTLDTGITQAARTSMTASNLYEQRCTSETELDLARRQVTRYRHDLDIHKILTEHVEAMPVQTIEQVQEVLQVLKDQKTILDFAMAANVVAIRWPKYQVILVGCRNHCPGRYELPPYQITGSLVKEPTIGISSITKLNGGEYPHPHARILCFNEEMNSSGVSIPNSMGLDNIRTLELLWSRDIVKALDLVSDYMASTTPGYAPLCCRGAKLLERLDPENLSPQDYATAEGNAEAKLQDRIATLDHAEDEIEPPRPTVRDTILQGPQGDTAHE